MSKRIMAVLVISIMMASTVVKADEPNRFQPKKHSAEVLVGLLGNCESRQGNTKRKFCSCILDAKRKNKASSGDFVESEGVKKTCEEWAQTVKGRKEPALTPYPIKPWGTETISVEVKACKDGRLKTGLFSEIAAFRYCGCLVDAARTHESTSAKRALSLVDQKTKARCLARTKARQ